uniref:DYW domain-containing protein n=1 Tax=Opuntia streptacantha TaxID=393608 RepID=A0A7C9ELX9_OPUST
MDTKRAISALSAYSAPTTQHIVDTYIFQCNKSSWEACERGLVDDACPVFDKMTQREREAVSCGSMIAGFSQKNRLNGTQELSDAFRVRNVRAWTSMLTGYAKAGQIKEARGVFDSMPEKNVISWNAMISAYVQNGDLLSARKLFDDMPQRNISSWNAMITGYSHDCMMTESKKLFEQMPERNSVSWMIMISGYIQIHRFLEAWNFFARMYHSGGLPDQPMFVVALSAVMGLRALGLVASLRSIAIKTAWESDVVVGTALLNAYTKNGKVHLATDFFNKMPERNEYSWTTMIAAFSLCGRLNDAIALYDRIPEQGVSSKTAMMTAYAQNGKIKEAELLFNNIQNPNIVTWNAMIAGYSQNGMLDKAKEVFVHMPVRNSASWGAMISGLAQNGQCEEALQLLAELHRLGNFPTHSCFTSSLFACANLGAIEIGRQIHALAIKRCCQYNPYVGNALISMYGKCKNMEDVSQVFSTMGIKDIVSWNSLISGFSQNHMLNEACETFVKMPERDVVSWTAIMSAYVQAGQVDAALQLFRDMLARGLKPNELTVTSLLSACGSAGALKLGEQMHGLLYKLGFESCLFVNNALITMYFKFGSQDGFAIFEDMDERDIITWNAVLAGCAHNGLGKDAIQIFNRMVAEGVLPDEMSFLGILCACSRSGLLTEARTYFNSMCEDHGIKPLIYHYTCMVDLLGRAGQLSEAEALVESMPVEPDSVIWETLLGACRIHHSIELAEKVAKRLFQMDTCKPGTYVLLSNLYASQNRWDKVEEMRELIKAQGISKEPGISWIHIRNMLYTFHTADKAHDFTEDVDKLLKRYYGLLSMTGYVPDTEFVLHDVEEEQKQNQLLYHSEKLALAFGILSMPSGCPILIMKNLRICGDCHTFMKFMSTVTRRKIVIRDRNRFHHFQDGSCTCGDYW